jgi:hypothetical protein
MPRPPSVPGTPSEPREVEAYGRTVARIESFSAVRRWGSEPGSVHPYYGALLHNPELADHVSSIGTVIRASAEAGGDSGLNLEVVETADLVVAVALQWNRAFFSHVAAAIDAGVRPEAVRAIWSRNLGSLTEEERDLYHFILRVLNGEMDDVSFAGIEGRLGERGAIELTVFIGFLVLNFRAMQALGIPDREEIDVEELIASLPIQDK